MKHEDRRKEAGKMLMDVTKYLLTAGLIGGILTEKMTFFTGVLFLIVAAAVFIIGFYAIPAKKEGN